MKSVAIVGGGPAGLVAAKTLLRHGQGDFQVTIFEKQDRVGGMWALNPDDLHRGKCHPHMPTNLSRFSVSFSDLAWQSIDLKESDLQQAQALPIYPKAWQVGRYLQEYARRYIPPDCLKLNCQVTHANKIVVEGKTQWRIRWSRVAQDSANDVSAGVPDGNAGEGMFDRLIVGPGFFGAPRAPSFEIAATEAAKVLHSSQFRVLESLISEPYPEKGSIVIVGGGISGSEAAVAVAMAQSNAMYAPQRTSPIPCYNIVHITSRPFYDIPRMNPQASPEIPEGGPDRAPGFLPNDLSMFNLSKIPPGEIVPNNGIAPRDKIAKTHPWMHSIIGGDQRDLKSEGLWFSEAHQELPAFIGITDHYSGFARSKSVRAIIGRVTKIGSSSNEGSSIVHYQGADGQERTVDHVVGVIHAAGFSPHSSLKWLDDVVLKDLEYDENSERLPLILHRHTTYHPAHPDVGFVGMYEGAFWAVMEAQAREIVTRWSSSDSGESAPLDYEEPDMHKLRAAMRGKSEDVPQFWMRDYLPMVECLSSRNGITRSDEGFGERAGPIIAARYTSEKDDSREATAARLDLQRVLRDHTEHSRFLQAAVFRGLHGRWAITRKLESFLPGFPSGTLHGNAHFHPRFTTDKLYDAEYLYIEDGTLTTDAGLTLKANKRYAYRYSEVEDQISVWFVKDDGKAIDYFFHNIAMSSRSKEAYKEGWRATGSHWCDPDQYECSYRFEFNGATLKRFEIKFVVKGPNKDYISQTRFEQPEVK